jgi:hypothetical protein
MVMCGTEPRVGDETAMINVEIDKHRPRRIRVIWLAKSTCLFVCENQWWQVLERHEEDESRSL